MINGFSVSRQGYEADTLDPNELIVTSLSTQMKITLQDQGTLTLPNGNFTGETGEPHGLGYRPAFRSYFEFPDDPGRYWMGGTFMGALGESAYESDSRIDLTNIYFYASREETGSASGAVNVNYAYLLFDQPAVMGASGNDKPIGYQESDNGLVVSMQGHDADTARLYDQQFNSNADYLKYHHTEPGAINYNNTSNGATTVNITHNLGYIPVFDMYGKSTEETFYTAAPQGRASNPFIASAGANKTNITVNLAWSGGGSGSNTFRHRVVIFKNRMVI